MHKQKFIWKIYFPFFCLIFISLFGVAYHSSKIFNDFFLTLTTQILKDKACLMGEEIRPLLIAKSFDPIDHFCKNSSKKISSRFTIILPEGTVVGDSVAEIKLLDNHASRPEIAKAMKGSTGSSIRWSDSLKKQIMYVAIPLFDKDTLLGVIRASIPITAIRQTVFDFNIRVAASGFFILILGIIASAYIAKKISLPLAKIKDGAEKLAAGDLTARIPIPESYEMSSVAYSLNHLAALLEARLMEIQSKQNEQNAVFSSMIEILLAIDNEEKLINLNKAAENYFHVSIADVRGKPVQEIIRNSDLRKFLKKAFESLNPVEGEISLRNEKEEKFLQAHATALKDSKEMRIGLLVVLNDVTRIKKLERIRRDFVANVSHELKTPVTSIKGYLETLINGAAEIPEDRERFLDTLYRQSERLNSIIDDLLSLSKIEQDVEKEEIHTEITILEKVIDSVILNSKIKTESKKIILERTGNEKIEIKVNSSLFEQAIMNLIDNAIKYSEENSRIIIHTVNKDNKIQISVQDFGCGIPQEHLSRLFERFYRVDKARSRKLGGTGLGLSIVKHIIEAHKGSVTVESTVGKGSIFTIHIEKQV